MTAWSTSKSMRCRPSELYGLTGIRAYCFDVAVNRWGNSLEADLNAAGDGEKDARKAQRARERVLDRYVPQTRRYRDPAKE
jgi:hypothetical protein